MKPTLPPALAALTCASFFFVHTWHQMTFNGLSLLLAAAAIWFTAQTASRHEDQERMREKNEHRDNQERAYSAHHP